MLRDALLSKSKLTFAEARGLLGVPKRSAIRFNLEDGKRKELKGDFTSVQFAHPAALGERWWQLSESQREALALLVERAGEGADTVQTAVSLRLAANFEHLVLTGSGAIAGVGNALANTITGNNGANLLRGFAGNDTLQGGAGADRFQFETNLNEAINVDTLRDFASGTDRIVLDDDVFRSFSAGASTRPGDGQFVTGTASVTAADANDFLLYDTSTGALYYDRDGSGPAAALKFAVLEGAPALVAADFLIVG